MANKKKSCCELVVLLILVIFLHDAAVGRKVGGRTQLRNVEDNKEVQELGRYCVREYNRHNSSEKLLVFSRVVEAQVQVVSGIKYYLKISANLAAAGPPETFQAVLLVKPWLRSKVLIDFTPSQPTSTD